MKKYVITAINHLTGEREDISAPRSYYRTRKLLQRWQLKTKDCQDPAWIDLKVKKVPDQKN